MEKINNDILMNVITTLESIRTDLMYMDAEDAEDDLPYACDHIQECIDTLFTISQEQKQDVKEDE